MSEFSPERVEKILNLTDRSDPTGTLTDDSAVMAHEVRRLRNEVAKLQEVVFSYPTTTDDVPVILGMPVWREGIEYVVASIILHDGCCWEVILIDERGEETEVVEGESSWGYSTRESGADR